MRLHAEEKLRSVLSATSFLTSSTFPKISGSTAVSTTIYRVRLSMFLSAQYRKHASVTKPALRLRFSSSFRKMQDPLLIPQQTVRVQKTIVLISTI